MTFAWHGLLCCRSTALWLAILASRGIAFFEFSPSPRPLQVWENGG